MQPSVQAVTPPYWPTSEKSFSLFSFPNYSFFVKCFCCKRSTVKTGFCRRECLPVSPFLLCWPDFIRWLVLFRFLLCFLWIPAVQWGRVHIETSHEGIEDEVQGQDESNRTCGWRKCSIGPIPFYLHLQDNGYYEMKIIGLLSTLLRKVPVRRFWIYGNTLSCFYLFK